MKTTVDAAQLVITRFRDSAAVKLAMAEDGQLLESIRNLAEACVHSLRHGGKLLFFGNGGSAADAQHLAAELVGRYLRKRSALPAIALTANTSSLTAIGNDYSYEEVFARQIEAFGARGDIAIGISTSGNSPNVIRAMNLAKKKSLTTVSMTGRAGGTLAEIADYRLCVPSQETPRIQEAHILVGHVLCEIIEDSFSE